MKHALKRLQDLQRQMEVLKAESDRLLKEGHRLLGEPQSGPPTLDKRQPRQKKARPESD